MTTEEYKEYLAGKKRKEQRDHALSKIQVFPLILIVLAIIIAF
jgi:biopolymer transport protein ExbD